MKHYISVRVVFWEISPNFTFFPMNGSSPQVSITIFEAFSRSGRLEL